jgi:hypothetical protein
MSNNPDNLGDKAVYNKLARPLVNKINRTNVLATEDKILWIAMSREY